MDDHPPMYTGLSWFTPADWAVLAFLAEHDIVASPGGIAHNIGYSAYRVRERCRVLEDHGLLRDVGDGDPYYQLTELGQKAAHRRVTAKQLDELVDRPGDDSA